MLGDRQPSAHGVPESPDEPSAVAVPADADARAPAPGHSPGRVRRLVGHGQQWLTSEQTRLQEELRTRRQRSGMVDAGFLVQELDANVGGGILAGALGFRLFLFMVPFVYVVFSVLDVASRAMDQDPAQLARTLGITGILASIVVKVGDQSAWTQAALVLGAIVAMLITAGSLLKALYVVHWLIWRIHRVMPAGLVPRLTLIGVTLLASALGVAANEVRASAGLAGAVLAVLIITALSFAVWWWVSWKLPHAPVPARALIPGAVLVAAGSIVLQLLTT